MTLVDTNVLVYAAFAQAPEHERARSWLQARFADTESPLALCWPVLYSFVRVISSTRAFGSNARRVTDAWSAALSYLEQPAVRLVTEGAGHRRIADELARTPGLRSEDAPDVQIAALAIEHGLTLATHDHGFRRFAQLRVVDPLASDD